MSYFIQKYSVKVQEGKGALKETRSVVKKGKPTFYASYDEMKQAIYSLKRKTKRAANNLNANLPIAKAISKDDDDQNEIVQLILTYRHDNFYPVVIQPHSVA